MASRTAMFVCAAVALFCIFFVFASASPNLPPQVVTKYGILQGVTLPNSVQAFLGIPYARPPVGTNRWAPPQTPQNWNGVKLANQYGSSCPQFTYGGNNVLSINEDCLYLNVFIPAADSSTALPVMVYIHGGGYVQGSSTWYPADQIVASSSEPVIVVTFNYRLGVLGFFPLPYLLSNKIDVNFGLLDQQFLLQWVSQNIAAFGGDPKRVTLFGESAGAGSIVSHLTWPSSYALFDNAILESPYDWHYEYNNQDSVAQRLATVGNNVKCNSLALSCLRNIGWQQFFASNMAVSLNFLPVVNGKSIPDQPTQLIVRGLVKPNVSIIIGNNLREGELLAYVANNNSVNMTTTTYDSLVNSYYSPYFQNQLSQIFSWYNEQAKDNGNFYAYASMTADSNFLCGTRIFADHLAETPNSHVYHYQFNYKAQNIPPPYNSLNTTHFDEVYFVFGAYPNGTSALGGFQFTNSEVTLADTMVNLWTSFAVNGFPFVGTAPTWPEYSPTNGANTFLIDSNISVTNVFFESVEYCTLWDALFYSF